MDYFLIPTDLRQPPMTVGLRLRAGRSAFTLVEILIALGLTVALLAAVYASLDLMRRFSVAGQEEMRTLQIVRSLTRVLSEDTGSIVFRLPEEDSATSDTQAADSSSSSTTSSSSSTSSSSTSGVGTGQTGNSGGSTSGTASGGSSTTSSSSNPMTVSTVDDSGIPVAFGLVGDSESFHLTVSKPSRELMYSSINVDEGNLIPTSDLQVVTWGLAPLSGDYLASIMKEVSVVSPPTSGLGRRSVELFGSIEVEPTLLEEHLLAPEITQVTFRYFDGAVWADTWDSQANAGLPRAIEISMGFIAIPRKPRGYRGVFVATPIITPYRQVISIPMSVPFVEDAAE